MLDTILEADTERHELLTRLETAEPEEMGEIWERLIAIDAFSLMRHLRQHPELTWQMLAVISRSLHALVGQIRSVSLHSAEQRVASYLLANHDPEEPALPIGGNPSRRSELASMLGLTTETLCRVIASFRRRGWIETADHQIVVSEPDALQDTLKRPRR